MIFSIFKERSINTNKYFSIILPRYVKKNHHSWFLHTYIVHIHTWTRTLHYLCFFLMLTLNRNSREIFNKKSIQRSIHLIRRRYTFENKFEGLKKKIKRRKKLHQSLIKMLGWKSRDSKICWSEERVSNEAELRHRRVLSGRKWRVRNSRGWNAIGVGRCVCTKIKRREISLARPCNFLAFPAKCLHALMAIRDETSFCARITSTDDIGYDPPRLRLRSGIKKFDPRPRELNLAVKDNMKYACTRV